MAKDDTTPKVNADSDAAAAQNEQNVLVASGERGEYIDLPASVKEDESNNLSPDTVAQLEVLPGQEVQGA